MSNLVATAKARDVRIDDLSVEPQRHAGRACTALRVDRHMVPGQGAEEATFDKLIQIIERGCIVHNKLSRSVRIEVKRM